MRIITRLHILEAVLHKTSMVQGHALAAAVAELHMIPTAGMHRMKTLIALAAVIVACFAQASARSLA